MTARRRAMIWLGVMALGCGLAVTGWPLHLPSMCVFQRVTGLPCMTCNMTHASCALAHGDFWGALRFHVGIVPFTLLVVASVALFVMEVVVNRRLVGAAWDKVGKWVFWGTSGTFMVGWAINLIRVIHGWKSGG